MPMATLQVKRVPDELYAAAKARAASEGLSLSEFVLRTIERQLAFPSRQQWLEQVASAREQLGPIDTRKYLDDAKDEIENG